MIPNSNITIYNKYTSNRLEKYQRSEVYGIVWQSTKAVSGSKAGLFASNVATVLIPFERGKDYIQPKAWQALTDKSDNWTLQEADLIVRGIISDEIGSAFTITDLREKYYSVVMITSVDAMDQGSQNMRHWEVGCK